MEIAAENSVNRKTVRLWSERFRGGGLQALWEIAPGRGRKPSYDATRIKTVIDATLQTKPKGSTHWSCRTMAAQGIGKSSVSRIWRSHNIKPHRTKTFKLSRDPKFLEKLTDVVGLYLSPPDLSRLFNFPDPDLSGGVNSSSADRVYRANFMAGQRPNLRIDAPLGDFLISIGTAVPSIENFFRKKTELSVVCGILLLKDAVSMALGNPSFRLTAPARDGWIPAAALLLAAVASAQVEGMYDFGNRFEGTAPHKNALEDFTLLAIHRGPVSYDRNVNLEVSFFAPQLGQQASAISVEALELQDSGLHYAMRSKPLNQWKPYQRNIFGPWPTRDVIDRLSLKPTNLGVLVSYNPPNSPPIYLPAAVSANATAASGSRYAVYYATGRDLQSLTVTVSTDTGKPVNLGLAPLKCETALNRNCKLYSGGSTQGFDVDLSSQPPGVYHLKFNGTIPRSTAVPAMEFAIYHDR
jgi:hypothetical protein